MKGRSHWERVGVLFFGFGFGLCACVCRFLGWTYKFQKVLGVLQLTVVLSKLNYFQLGLCCSALSKCKVGWSL